MEKIAIHHQLRNFAQIEFHPEPEIWLVGTCLKTQGLTGSDLFQIQTVQPYPEDYTATTRVAQDELSGNARPELTEMVADMDSYDVIYLGYRPSAIAIT